MPSEKVAAVDVETTSCTSKATELTQADASGGGPPAHDIDDAAHSTNDGFYERLDWQSTTAASSGSSLQQLAFLSVSDAPPPPQEEAGSVISDRFYRAVYDLTPVMMHSMNAEGVILHVNDYWLQVLGYERSEVVGRKGPDFLTPESREYALRVGIPKTLEQGHVRNDTIQMVKRDGGVIDVLVSSVFEKDEQGIPVRSYTTLLDITEQRRAEAAMRESEDRLNRVLESAGDAIIIIDRHRSITLFNSAAERAFGREAAEAIGTSFDDFGSRSLITQIENCFAGEPRSPGGEVIPQDMAWISKGATALRADGTPFPIEGTLSVFSAHGDRFCTVIVRDVDERLQAEERLRVLQLEKQVLQEERDAALGFEDIIGDSKPMRRLLVQVKKVAATDATALVLGETGTGKELIARAVHRRSDRCDKPLVCVNCAALPSGLIESELFGHEKGAFTGALARKVGRFELADGGSLLLDEVGDLPLDLQAKLLRVIQEGEFERLGGVETIRVDVRVIAATHRDLDDLVAAEKFREDLFYRLNVFPLEVPPLRQRDGDVSLLANYFAMHYASKMGKQISYIPSDTLSALTSYSWPGNVRELQNVIERAVILAEGEQLELAQWPPSKRGAAEASHQLRLEDVERSHILSVLKQTGGQIGGEHGAAEVLGLKPTTLQSRMKKLGIERNASGPR